MALGLNKRGQSNGGFCYHFTELLEVRLRKILAATAKLKPLIKLTHRVVFGKGEGEGEGEKEGERKKKKEKTILPLPPPPPLLPRCPVECV